MSSQIIDCSEIDKDNIINNKDIIIDNLVTAIKMFKILKIISPDLIIEQKNEILKLYYDISFDLDEIQLIKLNEIMHEFSKL
jgi:hypothetical protein